MSRSILFTCVLISQFILSLAWSNNNCSSAYLPLPVTTVHQFPNGTWLENIAVRHDGRLLVTDDIQPRIYQVDASGSQAPDLVYEFTGTASILGIVETEPDIFHICTANYSSQKLEGYGEGFIFRLNLTEYAHGALSATNVVKVATISDAGALDGVTFLADSNILLASDFLKGVIWSVGLDSGVVKVAINNTLTRSTGFQVNGLKAFRGEVYFTTTQQENLVRMSVDSHGHPTGPFSILAQGGFQPDDFALDSNGNAYVTNIATGANGIFFVAAGGGPVKQVAQMIGPTGCAFGRTLRDCHILYVTTTGGDYAYASNGTFTGAGSVVAVDLGTQARSVCRRQLSQESWIGYTGIPDL